MHLGSFRFASLEWPALVLLAVLLMFPNSSIAKGETHSFGGNLGRQNFALVQGKVSAAGAQYDIRPRSSKALGKDQVYQMMVNTACFPKFRLTMNSNSCLGDSGVASYLIGPPSYANITVFTPEDKKYCVMSIVDLMADHCRNTSAKPKVKYNRIFLTGRVKLLGHDCSIYKCQAKDWSKDTYDLLYLSDSIPVDQGLARAIADVSSVPRTKSVPLKFEKVFPGYKTSSLEVLSLKVGTNSSDVFRLKNGYMKTKDVTELIWGDQDTVDAMFQSDVKNLGKRSR